LNTHLQSQYPEYGRLYESERAAQIAKLEKIAANAARAHAVIAAGDFNTAPNEALYNVLTKSWQDLTIDARAAAGKRAVTHLGDGSSVWLDYILVWKDPRFKYAEDVRLIRNAKIDDPFSDHHGLTAVISVESSAGMRLLEAAVSAATFTRREWIKSTTGYIRQR
jgi:endonuclease/exonuclease/phosphatase family metal-dependent hydrolase